MTAKHINAKNVNFFTPCNGLFTFIDQDSIFDPDTDLTPVLCSEDWNLNPTPCRVNRSTEIKSTMEPFGLQSELETESVSESANVNKP